MRVAVSVQTEADKSKTALIDGCAKLCLQSPGGLGRDLILDRYVQARSMLVLRGEHSVEKFRDFITDFEHRRAR